MIDQPYVCRFPTHPFHGANRFDSNRFDLHIPEQTLTSADLALILVSFHLMCVLIVQIYNCGWSWKNWIDGHCQALTDSIDSLADAIELGQCAPSPFDDTILKTQRTNITIRVKDLRRDKEVERIDPRAHYDQKVLPELLQKVVCVPSYDHLSGRDDIPDRGEELNQVWKELMSFIRAGNNDNDDNDNDGDDDSSNSGASFSSSSDSDLLSKTIPDYA